MKQLYKYILAVGMALLWLLPTATGQISSYFPTEIKGGSTVYIIYESSSSQAPAATVNSIVKVSGDDINFTITNIGYTFSSYDSASQRYLHYYEMPVRINSIYRSATAVYNINSSLGALSINFAFGSSSIAGGGITPAHQQIDVGDTAQSLVHSRGGIITFSTPTYQWQVKSIDGQWANIAGATAQTYSPGQMSTPGVYFYRVYYNNSAYSSEAVILVEGSLEPQVITGSITPASQQVESGSAPATLTHTDHEGVTSRQWQRIVDDGLSPLVWTNIAGATADTYSPPAVPNVGMGSNITYSYRIVINGNANMFSDVATILITPAATEITPGFITPASQQVESGEAPAILTHAGHANVTARQWQVKAAGGSWQNVTGQTSETYSPAQITNTGDADITYSYRVKLNNSETYSAEATVTVTPEVAGEINAGKITPALQEIVFTGIPEPLVHTDYANVTSRQWQRLINIKTNTWENIEGATGISYSPERITHNGLQNSNDNVYGYRVVVNGNPALASEVGGIMLHPSNGNPGVVAPETQTVEAGEAVQELISNAAGTGSGSSYPLHCVQWQCKIGDGQWADIAGATEMSYSPGALPNSTSGDIVYSFRVYINNDPSRASVPATVTVTPFVNPGSVTPASQTVEWNETPMQLAHTEYANVTSRQWQYRKNYGSWFDINGATGITYTPATETNKTTNNIVYNYRVIVNNNENKISEEARITTKPDSLALVEKGIITPASQIKYVGETPETLFHTGHGEIVSRRWEMKRSDQGNLYWKTISGAAGATYSPPAFSEAGTYQFRIELNDINNFYTPVVSITVEDSLDPGYISPATQAIGSGGIAALLTHEGTAGSRGRQWQMKIGDGQWADIAGATGKTCEPGRLFVDTSNGIPVSGTNYYYRVVIGADESTSSESAMVNVSTTIANNPQAGYITPRSKTIAQGEDAGTLTHTGGDHVYTRQWQRKIYNREWQDIPGATGATYSPGPLYLDDAGGLPIDNKTPYTYRVKTTNTVNDNVLNSDEAVITVDAGIGIFRIGEVAPKSQATIYGTKPLSLFLTEVSGGSEDYTCQWQKSEDGEWQNIDGATDIIYLPGILAAGQTHWFRIAVRSGDAVKYSSCSVKVVANAAVFTGLNAAKNYIAKYTFREATQSPENTYLSIPGVVYYDDLGRPVQSVEIAASPMKYDIVTPVEYDMMGRSDVKSHLPYVGSGRTGGYDAAAITNKIAFYDNLHGTNDSNYSFVEKVYEASALDKPLSQYNAGSVYRSGGGKKVTYGYSVNSSQEVLKLNVDGTGNIQVSGYPAGDLYKNSVTNEDGLTVTTYTDGLGKTIMEQTSDGTTAMKTYYGYDDKQLLRWVISPEGSKNLNPGNYLTPAHSTLVDCAYMYNYDDSGSLIEKRLPGAEPIRFIYDSARRLVASQDGNRMWVLYKYDNFDRVIGQKLSELAEAQIKADFNSAYDNSANTLLSEYIYDTYEGVPENWGSMTKNHLLNSCDDRITGFKTYEKVGILGEQTFVERAFFYDNKGRVAIIAEKNGISESIYYTFYDFIGNVMETIEDHEWTESGQAKKYRIETGNSYDHRGRLLATTTSFIECYKDMEGMWHMATDYPTATVRYAYDELGRLVGKEYGEGDGLLPSVMTYNIQGWLTSQKSPHFNMNLGYFNAGRYSGNITHWDWKRPEYTTDPVATHAYDFTYDLFGRLLSGTSSVGFDETVVRTGSPYSGYDLNGNIRSMKRYDDEGLGADYRYSYTGNKLTRLYTGSGSNYDEYQYDHNGNMTYDGRKGLRFNYNFLNLVSEVTDNSSEQSLKAQYSYSADGAKLKVRGAAGEGYDYIGSMTLVRGENGLLTDIEYNFGFGMMRANETLFFEKDHLGSIRAAVNDSGEVVATNDYYPFGVRHMGGLRDDNIRYKFNGMEEQTTGGLNLLDYGARMYDNELGRWFVNDPLADKFYSISPYVYCFNNPVRFIDPDGKQPREWSKRKTQSVNNALNQVAEPSTYAGIKFDGSTFGTGFNFDAGGFNMGLSAGVGNAQAGINSNREFGINASAASVSVNLSFSGFGFEGSGSIANWSGSYNFNNNDAFYQFDWLTGGVNTNPSVGNAGDIKASLQLGPMQISAGTNPKKAKSNFVAILKVIAEVFKPDLGKIDESIKRKKENEEEFDDNNL